MIYSNGKIYKIISENSEKYYIGSTTQPLSKRFSDHKSNYKMFQNGKYDNCSSFNVVKEENCKIILIEEYPCENKNQLESRERYWIEQFKNNIVNKVIPTRTDKEYYNDNKDKAKEYRDGHKQETKQYNQKYYEEQKDKIKEKTKNYRLNNLDIIKQKQKIKHNCDCGGKYTNSGKSEHIKTTRHKLFLEKQTKPEI